MKLKKKNPNDLNFIMGCGGTAKGVGSICGIGVMTLQNMKTTGKVGAPVKKTNLVDGVASIYFATPESVSDLISDLTGIWADMLKLKSAPKIIEVNIDAPANNTPRRSNKLRKVPKSGAI